MKIRSISADINPLMANQCQCFSERAQASPWVKGSDSSYATFATAQLNYKCPNTVSQVLASAINLLDTAMENRLIQVREILNALVDQNGGAPFHSGKGRFWNLSRDVFVNGPIAGRKPIAIGKPADSFLVKILKEDTEGLPRMPIGGPYIAATDFLL